MVVLRVGRAQDVARAKQPLECPVPGHAGRPFVDAIAVVRRHRDVDHRELDEQPAADLPALVRPARRIRVQVVIDVRGPQVPDVPVRRRRRGKGVEQRERVPAPTEGHHVTCAVGVDQPLHLLGVWAQNAGEGNLRKDNPGFLQRALRRYRRFLGSAPAVVAGDFNNHV